MKLINTTRNLEKDLKSSKRKSGEKVVLLKMENINLFERDLIMKNGKINDFRLVFVKDVYVADASMLEFHHGCWPTKFWAQDGHLFQKHSPIQKGLNLGYNYKNRETGAVIQVFAE